MEDKFGYLMKAEFESHFIREVRSLLEERREDPKYRQGVSPWDLHNEVVLSWGGGHEKDKEGYKIR